MAEVRIPAPVRATWVATWDEFFDEEMRARVPGSLFLGEQEDGPEADGSQFWWYACPCGCGASGRVRVLEGRKPAQSPSWAWTGGTERPHLQPSVHHVGHWHGWLQHGYWVQTPGDEAGLP